VVMKQMERDTPWNTGARNLQPLPLRFHCCGNSELLIQKGPISVRNLLMLRNKDHKKYSSYIAFRRREVAECNLVTKAVCVVRTTR
jgi:hypothetical protein